MTNIEYIQNKETRENVHSCTMRRKTFAGLAEPVFLNVYGDLLDSKKWIPPTYVGTITLSLLGS
jgi:hypothetical protein